MIKVAGTERTVRECSAPYEYTEKGQTKTDQIQVFYYSLTIKEIKDYQLKLTAIAKKDPGTVIYLSETLAERLHSLPDLADAKGKPLAITVENLDAIDIRNLEAIRKAIDEDLAGKALPNK